MSALTDALAIVSTVLPAYIELTDTSEDEYAVLALLDEEPVYIADNTPMIIAPRIVVDVWRKGQLPDGRTGAIGEALAADEWQWLGNREDHVYFEGADWYMAGAEYRKLIFL